MHLIAVGQILIYLLPLHLLLADSFTYTGMKMHCLNSTILTLSSWRVRKYLLKPCSFPSMVVANLLEPLYTGLFFLHYYILN